MSMWQKGKILAVSSPGGHWVQLNKICDKLAPQHEIVFASPRNQYQLAKTDKIVHSITDASADSKFKLIPLVFQFLLIFLKERPHIILSTGAAPGVIAILLGKMLGIKTIWIDSIANVQQLSRSGSMVKKYADLVITQWPALATDGIIHKGSVL